MRIGASLKRLAVIAALAAAGCESSATTSVAPSASRCGVTLSVQPAAFAASGGQGTVSVGTNRECAWDARSEAAWLALSSAPAGQGSGTIAFTVSNNPVVAERRGAIVVNAQRVEVSQAQAVCVYRLDSTRRAIGPGATDISVAVSAQDGCPWTAASQAPWIAVAAGAAGSGNGVVTIVVAENPEHRRREGSLTIAGQAYVVEQAEAPLPAPPPPAPTPPPPTPAPPPSPGPSPPAPAPRRLAPPPAPTPAPPHRRRLRRLRRPRRLRHRPRRLHRRPRHAGTTAPTTSGAHADVQLRGVAACGHRPSRGRTRRDPRQHRSRVRVVRGQPGSVDHSQSHQRHRFRRRQARRRGESAGSQSNGHGPRGRQNRYGHAGGDRRSAGRLRGPAIRVERHVSGASIRGQRECSPHRRRHGLPQVVVQRVEERRHSPGARCPRRRRGSRNASRTRLGMSRTRR